MNLGQSDKFEIKIEQSSRRGSRSLVNAKFGHFTLFLYRGR